MVSKLDVETMQGKDLNYQCWCQDYDGNKIEFMQLDQNSMQSKVFKIIYQEVLSLAICLIKQKGMTPFRFNVIPFLNFSLST